MKNELLLVVMAVLLVSMVSMVSAKTIVAGKIYNADFSAVVGGASVDVTCGATVNSTVSLSDGTYVASFASAECDNNDTVMIHAIKAGVGENTINGTVYDYSALIPSLNLGIVNVPLVPEFGLIAGLIAVFGAVGAFFLIRRK